MKNKITNEQLLREIKSLKKKINKKEKCNRHDYKLTWFLFIPTGKICRKCGNEEIFGDSGSIGAF